MRLCAPKMHSHADPKTIKAIGVADAEEAKQGAPGAGGPHRPMPANVQYEPATIAALPVQAYPPPGYAVALQRALHGPFTGASPSPRGLGPQCGGRSPVCPPLLPPPSTLAVHCPRRIAHAQRDEAVIIGTTDLP